MERFRDSQKGSLHWFRTLVENFDKDFGPRRLLEIWLDHLPSSVQAQARRGILTLEWGKVDGHMAIKVGGVRAENFLRSLYFICRVWNLAHERAGTLTPQTQVDPNIWNLERAQETHAKIIGSPISPAR